MDDWVVYDTPCPICGGVVEWWYVAPDRRGNLGGRDINCKNCKRVFTHEEWEKIEHDFLAHEKEKKSESLMATLDEASRKVAELPGWVFGGVNPFAPGAPPELKEALFKSIDEHARRIV